MPFAFQSKIKRRGKRKSESPPTDDEGFESPTTPDNPNFNGNGNHFNGNQSNGNVKNFDRIAPLAMTEDIDYQEGDSILENGNGNVLNFENGEKHELEETKEQLITNGVAPAANKDLTVTNSIFLHCKLLSLDLIKLIH